MTKWKWSSVWDILQVFEKKIFCRIIQSISVISNSKCIYTACTIKSFSSIVLKLIFFFTSDDLSYGKEATHWRIYNSWYDDYLASNAIDRNTSTCTRTYEIGKGGSLKTTWWKVDLGKVKSIYSVQIDFKKYEGFGK